LFVFDAGYDPVQLAGGLTGRPVQLLTRLRSNRVFYQAASPRAAGQRGRDRRHGDAVRLADPVTWPQPTSVLDVNDEVYGQVQVQSWSRLHPKQDSYRDEHGRMSLVEGTLVRVQITRMPGRHAADPDPLWLWWSGPPSTEADLAVLWRAYLRRFDIEHTFRFAKQVLGWTVPKIRTPEQADRWTALVLAAYTQLRLARTLVTDHRLPWQPPQPPERLTPGRVRCGFRALRPKLGTPAKPPKPSGRGPGRPKGRTSRPAPRHPAIKKTGRKG
jgi:hypothetical protein